MNNQGNQSTGKAGNVMHLRKGFEHQTEKVQSELKYG